MKIVLCTHRFLPGFVGGVETYTFHLARTLQQLGHEVHILTGEPLPQKSRAVEIRRDTYENIPVIRVVYDYAQRSAGEWASYSDPLVTTQLKTILQKLHPTIIHATSMSLLMAGIIEAASMLHLPLVYTATDFVLICRRGTYLKRDGTICSEREELALCTACMGPHTRAEKLLTGVWRFVPSALAGHLLPLLEKTVGKRADFAQAADSIRHRLNYLPLWLPKIERIIAPSGHMRNMFVLNGFPADRIIIAPYGVQRAAAHFSKIPSSQLRFAFIGRVTFIKGVHLLLEAFMRLSAQGKAHLTIYGKADSGSEGYMQQLQNQAAHQPNIEFVGFVDNANLAQLYGQVDILLVPSIWPENSPITILEAQAHGIPVIASDVQGIADLVQHETNGLIFANQSIDELAQQMARCIETPELVTRLAQNSGLVRSIEDDVRQMVSLYTEISTSKLN